MLCAAGQNWCGLAFLLVLCCVVDQPDVVVGNASMWALLASTTVEVFVNTALLESGGVAVKGTTIVSITTEPVDLDRSPAAVCCPVLSCVAAVFGTHSRTFPCLFLWACGSLGASCWIEWGLWRE